MNGWVRVPKVTTIDFETHGIEARPDYPPKPVGVSIKRWGKKPRYYAFDHVVPHHRPDLAGAHRWNDSTREEAVAALKEAYANPDGVLFQNGKFDLDVAEVHLGLKPPPWYQVYETVFLLFLDDPNAKTVGLKSAAAKYLGMPPDEQDALAGWLVANQPVEGIRITRATGKTAKYPFGRYIAHAPGDVVGPYADGDVVRTERLFEHLYPRVVGADMLGAYDRERRMVPVLLRMEREGIRVDEKRLASDVSTYSSVIDRLEAWVRKRVGVTDLNIDAGADLVAALIDAGLADPARMGVTKKTGRTKSDKDAIRAGVTDPQLSAVLNYLARCKTCVRTFMEPWLATARRTGGLIFTNWNQVFGDRGGTRTGRFSSTPNFQNIPKEFEPIFASDEAHLPKAQRLGLPKAPFALPPLPMCRGYIVPYEKGHVLVGRDFCFSRDTEILTRDGFVRFDRLQADAEVAQWWHDGRINWTIPTARQRVAHVGPMTHIVGGHSCDLLTTVTHNHLLSHASGKLLSVPAHSFPVGRGFRQIGAGVYQGDDGKRLSDSLIVFVAALQADATVKHGGDRIVWKLKKQRKRDRLRRAFEGLGLEYSEVPCGDQVTITTKASLVPGLERLISLSTGKTFTDEWKEVPSESRLFFLQELRLWDGSGSETAWYYSSTNVRNVELVSELAPVTGLRTSIKWYRTATGRPFGMVIMRYESTTGTDKYRVEEVPGGDVVYCVSVPSGAIIVRRNGRTMVAGQSQQEPRILAHFDGAELMESYQRNPWKDYHDDAKAELEARFGRTYQRKPVKNINLGIIYGQGAGSLAVKNGSTVDETKALIRAIRSIYPGLEGMEKEMKRRYRAGEPITTWGGRVYYGEPPIIFEGRVITFDYKMINTLVQGSAADATKEAMLTFATQTGYAEVAADRMAKRAVDLATLYGWRMLLQVHDEIVLSVPAKHAEAAQEMLRAAMEGLDFDVPMLSEGSCSSQDWARMVDRDKKGRVLKVAGLPRQERVMTGDVTREDLTR